MLFFLFLQCTSELEAIQIDKWKFFGKKIPIHFKDNPGLVKQLSSTNKVQNFTPQFVEKVASTKLLQDSNSLLI
jgi:hypothetical protein